MDSTNFTPPLRWYQKFSGIMLVSIVTVLIVGVLFFGGTTIYYYWQIKNGNGAFLFQKFYGGFSADVKNTDQSGTFDRKTLELGTAPFLGANNPKVTIVEFVDFKCPYTKAEEPIIRQVMQKYGNKVKLIVRNFPVESTHPGSNQLSILAMCANEQHYYWPFHDWFFDNQESLGEDLSDDDIATLATHFDLDLPKMKACMDGQEMKTVVNKDYSDAASFGIGGTPTFFINGEKVEGVIPFDTWDGFLKNLK